MLELTDFYETYEVHQYANWQLIQNDKMLIPINQLQQADLVIYQPLSDVDNCYSTKKNNPNSFLNLLKNECNTISFPRIHNNAIFPIFHKTNNNKQLLYGKINNKPNSREELLYMYDNNLLDFDFDNRMAKNIEISKEKEKDTDVKIIDYIQANISKSKLFLTQDHPTTIIFNELTRQIANILDLNYDYNMGLTWDENITGLQDSVYGRSDCQYPISRYSINHYGFEYIKKEDKDANIFYRNII
jgi:hypothetical protein